MNLLEGILDSIDKLKKRVSRLESQGAPRWVMLAVPLTSTSWDGDARSTTAKTVIDLSAVFGVPAGVRAVLLSVGLRDVASAGGDYILILSPNDVDVQGLGTRVSGLPNDSYHNETHIIPCSATGDIYYQIAASGAGTMDIYLEIWGYLI